MVFGFCGVTAISAVDISQLACDAFDMVHGGGAIRANVGDIATVRRMHESQAPHSAMFSLGFPCQCLSTFFLLGDGLGGADARAAVLPLALDAAHMLQTRYVWLECVATVRKNEFAQGISSSQAEAHGLRTHQAEHTWPSVCGDVSRG